jgi:hypothetical protein
VRRGLEEGFFGKSIGKITRHARPTEGGEVSDVGEVRDEGGWCLDGLLTLLDRNWKARVSELRDWEVDGKVAGWGEREGHDDAIGYLVWVEVGGDEARCWAVAVRCARGVFAVGVVLLDDEGRWGEVRADEGVV